VRTWGSYTLVMIMTGTENYNIPIEKLLKPDIYVLRFMYLQKI